MKAKGLWLLPALVVLALIAGVTAFTWGVPYTGAVWDANGRILGTETGGPAERIGLQEGDVILAVDGASPAQWAGHVRRAFHAGEPVAVTLQRGGQVYTLSLTAEQFPLSYRFALTLFQVIALAYCLIALIVLLSRADTTEARLFYLMAQIWAADLAVGSLVPTGVPAAWTGMGILSSLLAPVIVHFHAVFPERRRLFMQRCVMAALYGVGVLAALLWVPLPFSRSPWEVTWAIMTLWLGLAFATAVGLVIAAYATAASPADRLRIRLIVVGTVVGFGPFGLLTVMTGWVSEMFTMPLMIAVPVAYAVALWRYNLLGFDRALNRGLVYLVVSGALAALYASVLTYLYGVLPADRAQRVAIAALAAVAVLAFRPLRDLVQRLVDRLFYGGWYEYRGLVEEVGRALARTLDAETLTDVLVRRVPEAMHLPGAALWLEQDGWMELVAAQGMESAAGVALSGAESVSGPSEMQLDSERALVPLIMEGRAVGVWALAARPGEGWAPEDRRILAALAQQAALAAQNVRLIAALRAKVAEIEEVHRRLLAAREEERAALARELHDGVIQDLVGLRYRLEGLEEGFVRGDDTSRLNEMHAQVGVLIDELRRLCSDLRPAALDSLGLAAALRALSREVTARGLPVEVQLEDVSLPESVAIGLYRVGQEALSNALRHAGASRATLTLAHEGDEVTLTVADDGRGFDPAAARGQAGRWGLLGMAERAQALGGRLTVESAPGAGTRVTVRCGIKD
jgi:signal transduction histidine kinase